MRRSSCPYNRERPHRTLELRPPEPKLKHSATRCSAAEEVAAAEDEAPTPNTDTKVNKSVRICFDLLTHSRSGCPAGGCPVKNP